MDTSGHISGHQVDKWTCPLVHLNVHLSTWCPLTCPPECPLVHLMSTSRGPVSTCVYFRFYLLSIFLVILCITFVCMMYQCILDGCLPYLSAHVVYVCPPTGSKSEKRLKKRGKIERGNAKLHMAWNTTMLPCWSRLWIIWILRDCLCLPIAHSSNTFSKYFAVFVRWFSPRAQSTRLTSHISNQELTRQGLPGPYAMKMICWS